MIAKLKKTIFRRLTFLIQDTHIVVSQAITIAVLAAAFPTAISIGSNAVVSALIAALFVTGSLVAALGVTYALFDYTKEGEYKLAMGLLTVKEKLFVFASTILVAGLGLQICSALFPGVLSIANYPAAIGLAIACEIVSIGAEQIERALTDKTDQDGPVRQGKKKPKQQK